MAVNIGAGESVPHTDVSDQVYEHSSLHWRDLFTTDPADADGVSVVAGDVRACVSLWPANLNRAISANDVMVTAMDPLAVDFDAGKTLSVPAVYLGKSDVAIVG